VNPYLRVADWRKDPVLFVREELGADPDGWQREVLQAFPVERRIALKACKGPGKTTVLAWLAWNFLATRPHPKVAATSISEDNLGDGLWTEMAKWQSKSKFLQESFTWRRTRIESKDHPETWWMSARAWSRAADPTQQADTLAGLHADYILFLIDESGGVPDAVAAAAEAALATGVEVKFLIAGNPTQLSGPLYRAFTSEKHLWWRKEITGDPDDPNRAARVDRVWALEQIEKYGRESPYVLVNVFGQFPPSQSNALLGVEQVAAAQRRVELEKDQEGQPLILGVDVARFGDDRTVFSVRKGRIVWPQRVYRDLDTMQTADLVARAIGELDPDGVFIDGVGVGGGVVDRLRQLGFNVIDVQSGGKALDPKFDDRRAEMWWQMAEWVKNGGSLPAGPELPQELSCPTYFFTPKGKIRLESKADVKQRTGGGSPDLGDSIAFTFAIPNLPAKPRHYGKDFHFKAPQPIVGRAETEYDLFRDQG